jgi:rhamnulokinase
MHYLACDLGAESGRVISGNIENGFLTLKELHRFANVPLRSEGSLHWNFPNLILELKEGLRKAVKAGVDFKSISTDSWGVDYVLFNSDGEVLSPIFHYRDSRSKRGVERALKTINYETIFKETGIQFMPINTLFQLAAEDPHRLRSAKVVLGVADAVNDFLSGEQKIEVSMASTFQLYNPQLRKWSRKLIDALELPLSIFPEIVPSGARLGKLRPALAREVGLPEIDVIATCSHDTGAAVVGVPASGGNWAYLSSGTWSLMGVELIDPVINDLTRQFNFTNEIGFGHSVRLLKNISGLWLIQECKRQWSCEGKEFDYALLTKLAAESKPFGCLINPASEEFLAPENMPAQIAEFCRQTGQPIPATEGAYIRCALESLALLYQRTLHQIEQITGLKIERLHVVGGGSNNELLNQFTADAVGIPVLAGPAEATAAGNILIQAIALGELRSLADARNVVRRSTQLKQFEPRASSEWTQALHRFGQFFEKQDVPQ